MQLTKMNPNKIQHAQWNPVSRTNEKSLRDLLDDIKEHGIQKPLDVTEDGLLLDGHRRLWCAEALKIKTVPVLVHKTDPASWYQRHNDRRLNKPLSPAEWLEVYIQGGEPPQLIKRKIQKLEEIVGLEQMEAFAGMGISPAIYDLGKHVARYCDKDEPQFIKSAIQWLVGLKQNFAVRAAMRDCAPPEVIVQAIDNDGRLEHTWWVA